MPKTKDIAQSTLNIIEAGYYINAEGYRVDISNAMEHAVANTQLYTPAALDDLLQQVTKTGEQATVFEVCNETALDAVRRLSARPGSIMCLNFASAKNPGGGFLGGAVAQEECIARASGLYPCLLTKRAYYDYHRRLDTCLYSDHMIYSPLVPVFKKENGGLMGRPVLVSIITSPAVNAGVVLRNEPEHINLIRPVMTVRIEKMLALSLLHGHDTLVLGAWGCGVFQNKPSDLAELFHAALTGPFAGAFKKVVFAVYTNKDSIIAPFRELFQ